MNTNHISLLILALLLALSLRDAQGFPPAPLHEVYGIVRNENGRPLDRGEGIIILSSGSIESTRGPSDPLAGDGTNYRLNVPMDNNIVAGMYQVSALRPTLPFSIRVVIGSLNYVPIQMTGNVWQIGKPGLRTRLDLTLGVDSDGDGLPDGWEQILIDSDFSGRLLSLADLNPNDDLDGDGLTNLQEFQLGTYALDHADGLKLEIVDVVNGMARLRFACVSGRTYRIKSSSDLRTWQAAGFATAPEGGQITSLRATDTTLLEIFTPVGGARGLSYRLYGE